MAKTTLFVFAKISPKAEYFGDAKEAITSIVQLTREEAGCLQFELYVDLSDEKLYLYEEWESEQDLEQHYQQPYTAAVFESYKNWLSDPVEITKMRKPLLQMSPT
ncbi:MAG: antibiotic biosynthesis monooxygenase [Legionellaceae bacterium]|nr:antibiotic biosynthesis monooxygenase [Legionellaceae bacterium]|tara:strand:- start:950 stop:1264 length:315 start_codon:yes stop_codon:yes gene_type:complete